MNCIKIKKRAVIAFLITLFVMLLLQNFWITNKTFQCELFVILSVLLYLLSYKLVDYIADFKTVKNKSRIDIIFLIIFFTLLFIPMSHIDNSVISQKENRTLAKWKPLIKNSKINYNFGKDFDAWYNDRFYFRGKTNTIYTTIKYLININYIHKGKLTLYKKKNLMYTESFWGLAPINKENKVKIFKKYLENIKYLQAYCQKHNIKIYLLIVPRQCDFFDYKMHDNRKYHPDPANELIEYLKNNTNLEIVYPKALLDEANKQTPVFFKTDHHWTKKGAYVSYAELIKRIQKTYPDIPLLEEKNLIKYYDKRVSYSLNQKLFQGQTYIGMSLPDRYINKILDTKYLYYKNSNKKYLTYSDYNISGFDKRYDEALYYPYGADKKVMVIGNSFSRNLMEFLPYSFKKTIRFYDNQRGLHFNLYENAITQFKPDIIIINCETRYLFNLLNITKLKRGLINAI